MNVSRRLTRELKERGKMLARWLNDDLPYTTPPNPAGRARILQILQLLLQIQAKRRSDLRLWEQPEIEQMARELDSITRVYRTWPSFTVDHRPGKIGNITVAHMWEGGPLEETEALAAIEALVKASVLKRLAFCATCKTRWIFRSKADLKYCSLKCRQARYEKSAQRRAQKKKHNRAYYQRWLKRKRKKHGKR
jgi:hypothetical protein